MEIDQAIRNLLTQVGPRDAARTIADSFEFMAKRRLLAVTAEPDIVLSPDELLQLEALAQERHPQFRWLSARDAYELVRKTEPDHSTLIKLGRQLSDRYRKQGRNGSVRTYRVDVSPIAPWQP